MPAGLSEGITLLSQSRLVCKLPRKPSSKPAAALPFWSFSLRLYARPGVPEACLDLQDRRGLDVNLVLFCCWRASRGLALRPEDVARADRWVRGWRRNVIRPLRRVRRNLKNDSFGMPTKMAAALRRQIARIEIGAERAAQNRLARLPHDTPEPMDPSGLLEANLRAYFDHAGLVAGRQDRRSWARISAACGLADPPRRSRPSA